LKVIVEKLNDVPGSIATRNRIKIRWERASKWIFEIKKSQAKGTKAVESELV
jgi:hypothetical protein